MAWHGFMINLSLKERRDPVKKVQACLRLMQSGKAGSGTECQGRVGFGSVMSG